MGDWQPGRSRRYPAPYHTPAGEAARLREIIQIYSYSPEAVEKATKTLEEHLKKHPELASSTFDTVADTARDTLKRNQ